MFVINDLYITYIKLMIDDIHTYIDNKGDIRINEALCSLALMQLKKELVIFHSNYAFWATVYITDDFYDEHVDLLIENSGKMSDRK